MIGPIALALAATWAWPWLQAHAQTTNTPPAFRLDPVNVIGKATGLHDVASESDLVGPANQPEWTTRRAFAETDLYVVPSGEIEFNQFYVSSHPRHGKPENLFESEFEFGLPWRTQFDVEINYSIALMAEGWGTMRRCWNFLMRWRTCPRKTVPVPFSSSAMEF